MATTVKSRYSSYRYNPHIERDAAGGAVRQGHYEQAQRYEALYKEYRALAKKADQRMVRLEKLSQEKYFHGITEFAYRVAQRDISTYGQEGIRFNTAPPENLQQLQAKVADIKKFLELPTSTKKGIVDIYQRRADTVNEKYGTSFTWRELAEFYDSGMAADLDSKFKASKTVLYAIGVIQNANLTPDQIESGAYKNTILSDDKVQDAMAKRLLASGFRIEDLK